MGETVRMSGTVMCVCDNSTRPRTETKNSRYEDELDSLLARSGLGETPHPA